MFYHETLRIYHKSFLLILLAIISLPSGSINMFCYTYFKHTDGQFCIKETF